MFLYNKGYKTGNHLLKIWKICFRVRFLRLMLKISKITYLSKHAFTLSIKFDKYKLNLRNFILFL